MSCSPTPNSPKDPPAAEKSRLFAIAVAVILGAVFYGLNNSSVNPWQVFDGAEHHAVIASGGAPGHARRNSPRQYQSGHDDRCGSADAAARQQRAGNQRAEQIATNDLNRAQRTDLPAAFFCAL